MSYAKSEEIALKETDDFVMTIGKGVSAFIDGRRIICGNEKLVQEENNISISEDAQTVITAWREQGKAVIIVADENAVLGIITLSDTFKKESALAIANLQKTALQEPFCLQATMKRLPST